MTDINWSEIAEEADNTPAAALATALGKVGERAACAAVILIKWEEGPDWYYDTVGGGLVCLGLMDAAHQMIRNECMGEPTSDV